MKEETDFLGELFQRISQKIQKPYQQIKSIEDELRKNWYDTMDAVLKITDQEYEKMNIPLRIVTEIRSCLRQNSDQNKEKVPTISEQQIEKPVEKKIINDTKLTESIMLRATKVMEEALLLKYQFLPEQLIKVLTTIKTIIKNIVSDPFELKFRTLKKANGTIQKNIVENESVLTFLKSVGFEEDQETIFLDKFETHEYYFLEDCLDQILEYHKGYQEEGQKLKTKKNTQQKSKTNDEFSRFIPQDQICFPKTEEDLKGVFNQQKLEEANYAEVLDKLISYRNALMEKPPQNRNIKIYHRKYEIKNVDFAQINIEDEFEHSSNSEIAKYWVGLVKNNSKNSKFQSKRKLEFQYLMKQKVYRETIIKVRLPNDLIIQASFGPLEKLKDVFNVLAEIVIGDLYLFVTPPVKRLDKEMDRTLMALDSVPTGVFYLGVNSQWYIKADYASITRV